MNKPSSPTLKAKDAPDLGRFDWEDPFRLEDQLSEEERMLRDAARSYAQDRLQPRVTQAYRDEATDPAIFAEMGEMGLLGLTIPRGIRWAWRFLCGLRPCRARGGAGGFRLSLDDVGAILAGDVSDLCLRHRGAAATVSAKACIGRMDRLFRADGA